MRQRHIEFPLQLSVVIPAYREAAHLARLADALEGVLSTLDCSYEVIIVDDGSPDDTYGALVELADNRPWLTGIRLSRNFGKEAALQAGLEQARGRAVVTMDADLQHPPEVIPKMFEAWRNGAQVVHAVKADRRAQGRIYSFGAKLVTDAIARVTGIPLQNASDFKLLDRSVVDVIVHSLAERERLYRGLAHWVGFQQVFIEFDVARGTRDDRRWSLLGLIKLAVTSLVSFTSLPMQLVTLFGVATLVLSLILGADGVVSWWQGRAVSGFLTIILTLLILGSFIMISLGIIGIYIAKIYEEIKQRPLYIIQSRTEHRQGLSGSIIESLKRPEMIGREVPDENDSGSEYLS